MDTPALKRHRPGRTWAAIEGVVVTLIVLIVVTAAWLNDIHSLVRLGLLVGCWGLVGYLVWRSIHAHRRGSHDS